jgi:hypothetical protein
MGGDASASPPRDVSTINTESFPRLPLTAR